MERIWLKHYPPDVPADIDPSVYPTLVSLLEESFARYRDARAYVCMGKAITFGEIDTLSKALAAWLQGRASYERIARSGARAARQGNAKRLFVLLDKAGKALAEGDQSVASFGFQQCA